MDFNNVSRFTKQRYSRFQLFQFIFKENGHVVISWESKIGLGSLRVHLSINHDFFFPKLRKFILFILATSLNPSLTLSFSCIRTKVFYKILTDSDSHRPYLYLLCVPNLVSLSETIFPSPEVKKWKDALHICVGQNLETGLVK